jgi:hypothetical protein
MHCACSLQIAIHASLTYANPDHCRITSPLLLISLGFLVGGFAAINKFGAVVLSVS